MALKLECSECGGDRFDIRSMVHVSEGRVAVTYRCVSGGCEHLTTIIRNGFDDPTRGIEVRVSEHDKIL